METHSAGFLELWLTFIYNQKYSVPDIGEKRTDAAQQLLQLVHPSIPYRHMTYKSRNTI
jgi:hypothetical protein